ncbi:TonB-dependent receptor [Flavitalea sp. BT771]|uniref:TonB-dependent receptor n=1 Tax=Flavitalea sp. BT771 TaxID=3063329 RepID=UPI0026E20BF4|nr:TonB-dependent receptor [Flavitalea sp. BT771]MDO6434089.1 TonB-dependent receptor [Flavitalea sp. BT771]MDV6222989.1 TonB-dependent receptor [Flavitalea sp. BT771]
MKKFLLPVFLVINGFASAQEAVPPSFLSDSADTKPLQEAVVKAYEQHRKLSDVGAPISIVSKAALNRFGNSSILPAMNANPGVRMEERSPGSYRLNIRGSSLRSPFGVRDIKVYWNEIPLTDPGGNTYLNQLGFYNFQSMEIIKGTAGSLYGAGIGGAVLINSMPAVWEKGVTVDYGRGSWNAQNINVNIRTGDEDHRNIFSYTHQNSDGYRSWTAMRRDVASWETQLKTSEKQSIHAYILYSDLYYRTPGGLTLAEYLKDPRQARPSTPTQQGAIQARAAIYQKNFTAGFSSQYHFNEHWQNTTAVYGAYTDFRNPGIRVYEIRQEPHFGGRTVFQYKTRLGENSLQINAGAEAQKGFFETRDYANKQGVQDTLQTDDRIGNWQYILFAQADLRLNAGWTVTAGASFNRNTLQLTRTSIIPPVTNDIHFANKFAPRISILKKILPDISLYVSAARGFSTPTAQELQKTNGLLGPRLQPEDGTDYEVGTRGNLFHGKLFFDVNAFFFYLSNTIVQRIDSNGVGYSINAGRTNQHGIESFVSYQLADAPKGFFSSVRLWASHTWHDFHYRDFSTGGHDYSGNRLPSVPTHTVVTGADILLQPGFYTNITFTYAERIALNDANTAYAGSYNLLGARAGYRKAFHARWKLDIYAGGDNLLNTRYSLGNDINAAAPPARYYNAAPRVNYFGGVSVNYLL